MIAPVSADIWNAASAGPPLRSRPTMSAMAACCAGFSVPAPMPATTESTTSAGRSDANPVTAVAAR